MKKTIALLLAAVMSLSLIFCFLTLPKTLSHPFSKGHRIVLIINARHSPAKNGENRVSTFSTVPITVPVLVAAQYMTKVKVMIIRIYLSSFLLTGITRFC